MDTSKAIKRTIEIEEFTNRFLIHPLSARLVPALHRRDIHPNTVSLTGALSGAIAAVCYYNYTHRWACIAGFLFMIGWHVLDGADGQLARLSGKVTASGYVIDGICDYTTFVFVYVALALRLATFHGNWVWIAAIAAGLSHIVQSAAFELQRSSYIRWVSGRTFAVVDAQPHAKPTGLLGVLAAIYGWVQQPFRPLSEPLATRLRTHGGSDPAKAQAVSEAYRERFRKAVLHWSWLSANNHTIAIFVASVLGVPLAYFLFEIIVLNGALVLLVRMNRARTARLADWLAINGG